MLSPSDKVSAYELIAPLGKGGMAQLYLARRHGEGGFSRLRWAVTGLCSGQRRQQEELNNETDGERQGSFDHSVLKVSLDFISPADERISAKRHTATGPLHHTDFQSNA